MKITNAFGMKFSGTIGKGVTASSWKGVQYLREYREKSKSSTEVQVEHRQRFADAVATWQMLMPEERAKYNREARRMSGFNLFVRQYLAGGKTFSSGP